MQLRPIYTEPENCQDCYKCIRECPVKAIRMEDNKASIIAERCIYCGHCTQVCPTGAKKIPARPTYSHVLAGIVLSILTGNSNYPQWKKRRTSVSI